MRDNSKSIVINDANKKRQHHFTNPVEKAQHGKLLTLVDILLEQQKKHREARIERDKELYERQIKMVNTQVDRLVYELYGLMEEEIKLIGSA